MPVYEYQCGACGHQFEEWQKIKDPPIKTCPTCGKDEVQRLISQTAFQLKGGGWYKDLYSSSKSSSPADKSSGGSSGKADSSSKSDAGAGSSGSGSESKGSSSSTSSTSSSSSGGSGGSGGSSSGTTSSK